MQPYQFQQLYDGYLWRRDQEYLFWGQFLLPFTNYITKEGHRSRSVWDFVRPFLSRRMQDEYDRQQREEKQDKEQQLKKQFNGLI